MIAFFFFFFFDDYRQKADKLIEELCEYVSENYPVDEAAENVKLRQYVFRISNWNKLAEYE